MSKEVFITTVTSYFPNSPIDNNSMEDYLGLISGVHSRVKNIVLRQNGIKQRFYAVNTKQEMTHTNAELAQLSIQKLLTEALLPLQELELLACATASPDQVLPSHASMVHGLLKNAPMEIFSASGICLSCVQAFKIAYLSILAGDKRNAVCSCSELASAGLLSKNFDVEYEKCANLGIQPYMALEKDFLRFMLSDGASAVLLQDNPGKGKALHIEWVEMTSYANELTDRSLFTVKQDIKLLEKNAVPYWAKHIKYCLEKYNVAPESISYVLPHVSSMFFYDKIINA